MGVNYNPKIVTDGLVSYYDPGNTLSYSGSGTALNDLTGNYNGTLTGSPPFSSTTAGGTFTFEDNDTITLGSLPQTQQYTYEFAFKPVDYTDAVNNNYQKMIINSANSFFIILEEQRYFRHRVPGVDASGNVGGVTIFDIDEFAVATFSYDQSNSKNYKNGVLLNSKSIGSGTVTSGTISLFTSSGPVQQYVGGFGFFRVYDRALSDAEVAQNFEALRGRFGL